MGGVMRNPASSCPLKGRVCPHPPHTHTHTPILHTKRHTKENFLKNRIVASTPILSIGNPPMTPWWDARAMGWVGAWMPGTVTGWGSRANHENAILDNLPGKRYYPPSNEERGKKRCLWREGRTSDKHDLCMRWKGRLAGLVHRYSNAL